jgi:signal transduction histidine kinase
MPFASRTEGGHLRLWRTTPFRMTVIFSGVFAVGVVALVLMIYVAAAGYLTQQMDKIVLGQAGALAAGRAETLPDRIAQAQAADVRQVNYYGLFSADGIWITGNVRTLPRDLVVDGAPRELHGAPFHPGAQGLARRLPWGEILVVGYDAKVLSDFRRILARSLLEFGAIVLVLGLALGAALSLRPLKRLQGVQRASEPILQGDLTARLPVSRRGDEIDVLARIANTMMAEVERLLGEVQVVGQNVAHDLRTPLNRLRALLYRTSQCLGEGQPGHAAVEQALEETDDLLARFRALQRIAEIDRRERRAGFAAVELGPLLRDVHELYEPLAEEAALTLALELCPVAPIQADGELLFEAVSNLVANAIKFTPPGGRVALRLEAAAEGPRIQVIDSGPGVAEGERESVLQRFYRSPGREQTPGSGLGLSIVAAVVRLHGFRLTLADAGPGLRVVIDGWPEA